MRKQLAVLAVAFLVFSVASARAQNQPVDPGAPQGQSTDSQPGAGRISFIHGNVSTQRGDNGEWVAAGLNAPLLEGDRVATGQKSRAEIELDYADILRMAPDATAKVATLNRNTIQVQVGQGLTSYSVLDGGQASAEIDTPNAAVHPDGPGVYRILVNSDAETQVTVRAGTAEISTPQGTTQVGAGQIITIAGTNNPQYQTASAPPRDNWDAWNDDRNHKITSAGSWRRTDRYYTGSEDLDDYGHWTDDPDYGSVWIPNDEGPDWAPYRDGRWVWEPYYGWTWVDDEPWGWAPYHYGRWMLYDDDWAWWPGPVGIYPAYYPIWAPAYVNFFGYGGGGWGVGFGMGFGFGGFDDFGWMPCGPGDWYHPWYGGWGNRFNSYNMTNINNTTIINNYHNGFSPLGRGRQNFSTINQSLRNSRVRAGFSSMPAKSFGQGRVPGQQHGISGAAFQKTSLFTGKMPASPTRASYSPTGRAANPSTYRNAPPSSQHFFSSPSRATAGSRGPASRSFANSGAANRPQSGFGANRGNTSLQRSATQSPASASNRPFSAGTSGARGPMQTGGVNRGGQGIRPGNGAVGGSSPARATGSGWHAFSPSQGGNVNRGGQGIRPGNGAVGGSSPARATGSGWHAFTPSQGGVNRGSIGNRPSGSSYGSASRYAGGNQGGWHQFSPHSYGSQGNGRGYSNGYSRPPLNMRQPIVRPRGGSSGNYGNYGGGGYRGGGGGGGGGYRGGGNYGGGGYRGGGGGGYRGGGGFHGGGGGGFHGGGGGGFHGGGGGGFHGGGGGGGFHGGGGGRR